MLEIVYRCHDYAVIFKPLGMLSEENAETDAANAPKALREALSEEGFAAQNVHTVHRLDRTTEGLMVYALNPTAAARLSRIIADGKLEKRYSALISLPPEFPNFGEMHDRLYFDRRRDKAFVADSSRKGAREAALSYELVKTGVYKDTAAASARIRLQTGRTHQIRVQFASRRAPLLGDGKYGSRVNFKSASLRSVELSFPWEGKTVRYEVPELELPASR